MKYADGMAKLPGGQFVMGSDRHYPEERPARPVEVGPFRIDRHLVTNVAFARFVTATGYVTIAERPIEPNEYPHVHPAVLEPGSTVFKQTSAASHRDRWWHYVPGAHWRRPDGDSAAQPCHPVVHIAYPDALAYAAWVGKVLPAEAEWEYAACGGNSEFAWGDELTPDGVHMANLWQGYFPSENLAEDGYTNTSPVGSFPPNAHGIFDMIGNVWEWTADRYFPPANRRPCCGPNAQGFDGVQHVIKGGSHLCAPNYCRRYRPAARQGQSIDTGTSHLGFRCLVRIR